MRNSRPSTSYHSRNEGGRGRGNRQRNSQNGPPVALNRTTTWASAPRMASGKSLVNERRIMSTLALEQEHLGAPPKALRQELVQARLILPGKHLLPQGLHAPSAFHEIRRTHCVWITFVEPNVIEIHGKSMPSLQEAVKAINAAVRDLRLSSHHRITRFFVQMPTKPCDDSSIQLEIGSRAEVLGRTHHPIDISPAVAAFMRQLQPHLLPSLGNLMAERKDLRMRVNFGQVKIRETGTTFDNSVNYDTFATMMAQSSINQGATFGTRLTNTQTADLLAQRLADPALGICDATDVVSHTHSVSFLVSGGEFAAAILTLPGTNKCQLSTGRMLEREPSACLNWIMAAPDSRLDWNIRIDSLDATGDVPAELQTLAQKLSVKLEIDPNNGVNFFKLPGLALQRPVKPRSQIEHVRLTTSTVIPFRDSPYVAEISVSQTWQGLNITAQPEKSWRVEFYGLHWDEAINHVGCDGGKKDWGVGLKNIWPGTDSSLESRFGDFVRSILEFQIVLDGMQSAAAAS